MERAEDCVRKNGWDTEECLVKSRWTFSKLPEFNSCVYKQPIESIFFLNQGNTDLHQIHWVQVDQWGSFLTVQPGAAEQLTTFLLRKAAPFLVYHFIFGYSTVYQSRRLHKSAQPKAMFFFPTCKMPPSCCVLRVKAVSCVYQFVLQSEQNSQFSCVFNTMPLNCHTHTQKKAGTFQRGSRSHPRAMLLHLLSMLQSVYFQQTDEFVK